MIVHVAKIAALALALVACLFLPFLPGDYDGLTRTLAAMAALFGFAGLILVPLGAGWLVYEIKKRGATAAEPLRSRKEYYFALAAIACSLPVAAMVTLGAWATVGPSAAAIFLVMLAGYFVWQIVPQLRRLRNAESGGFNPAPLYLVTLPVVVVLSLYAFSERAEEFSRRRAMDNATPLIDDIEAYRQRHGRYPMSLLSEVEDYKPSLRGIPRYYYEPNGETYNVFFEQFTFALGTREFVMYNPRDEQEMTAHDMDLLRIEPENILRGYHAVHDAGRPHWKRFLFD